MFGSVDDGPVLVHNDFGPNNVVMGLDLTEVRLLCDWEWAALGHRYTDLARAGLAWPGLAWAEFIVRYHHPEFVTNLQPASSSPQQSRSPIQRCPPPACVGCTQGPSRGPPKGV